MEEGRVNGEHRGIQGLQHVVEWNCIHRIPLLGERLEPPCAAIQMYMSFKMCLTNVFLCNVHLLFQRV